VATTEFAKFEYSHREIHAFFERGMLGRLVLFGEKSLPSAISEFIVHYQRERNHQGMQNRLIQPGAEAAGLQGEIACRNRLGGMIQYYYRKAA
jgi:putative transposase